MTDVDVTEDFASQACVPCREKKRKCSRELPSCSLCRRNRRRCSYPPKAITPTTSSVDSSGMQEQEEFPALFFLDFYTFTQRKDIISTPKPTLSENYYKQLGSREQLRSDIDTYFASVHVFLPIVSRLRIYRVLNGPPGILDSDMVILSLAMKMHCQPRKEYDLVRTEMYTLVKQGCLEAEQNNVLSVKLLQAFLLVVLYEIGNAIYPAAYLTIGHCARLGYAMGIHNRLNAPQMFSQPVSWAEAEERRRVWWAVIVLDRFVNIGGGNRPFAAHDAKSDDLLPMDEDIWDKGDFVVIQPLAVSEYATLRTSAFARTCQASHLLSHVLRHLNEKNEDIKAQYHEAMQLHHVIDTFRNAMNQEIGNMSDEIYSSGHRVPHFTAMGICYSAQIALYDAYMCADADGMQGVGIPEQFEMQQVAISVSRTHLSAFISLRA
ncbi:fungal-specific transcription factor domain-containing protein [Trichoderma camerunense]